jgi:predicted Zn-dependent peptidase
MADFTRYDYVVPPSDLELVLKVEAERLTSLQITRHIIQQEAPKCHQEALIVEQSPQAGMLKFAFNAFNQAWRHGVTEVRVKSGLENVAPEALASFYRASYVPGNLLLVLIGGFDRDAALKLVRKHLGSIQPSQLPPPSPVPWAKVSKDMSVRWDSKVRAVCIAFPPPEEAADRAALSLWGGLLMQKLMTDPDIQAAAESVFCSNPIWNVGTLPFFIYATARPGTNVADLKDLLASRLQTMRSQKPAGLELMQLKLMANQFNQPPVADWNAVTQQSKMLASQFGADPEKAVGMVLGNIALQSGVRESLLGPEPEDCARKLQQLTADDLHRIVQRNLDPSGQFVTTLTPLEEDAPGRPAGWGPRAR